MITLLGRNSQLARCLNQMIQYPIDILSSKDLDLRDHSNIKNILGNFSNKILINCFAYNDVEGAETSQDAFNINHTGVQEIAKFCNENDILLIHFSTDFIFDGKKGLYVESDSVNPINQYGKSKLGGERAIQRTCSRYIIIRTSWLYSHIETENNFLYKIKSIAMKDNQTFHGAEDILGSPTSALGLATRVSNLIKLLEGYDFSNMLFHLSDTGCVSKFDFLETIIKHLNQKFNLSNSVKPVSNSYFNLVAPRPYNTSLNSTLFSELFQLEQFDWDDSLKQTIDLL